MNKKKLREELGLTPEERDDIYSLWLKRPETAGDLANRMLKAQLDKVLKSDLALIDEVNEEVKITRAVSKSKDSPIIWIPLVAVIPLSELKDEG
ncbi:hypothetical protein LCGC14_0420330 [marine sediment metagenome]|uniref:Uncharacterized protein n=1 Tax=marine sediment metagenome TaxID=412755 RepID=A0A0F9SX30_9ZZZZ